MQSLLIVDDEKDFARGMARIVSAKIPEMKVLMAHTGKEALEVLAGEPVAVMLLDLNMPGMHGLDVAHEARKRHPDITIIVLTAYGTVETAVAALKQGAWDFLTKPVRSEDLLRTLSKAMEHSRLLGENQRLRQLVGQSALAGRIIGDSPPMRRLKENIAAVAASSYTVLIRGESGTGKELVAEAIHAASDRQGLPFIKVNCPAIPEQLLESELFGHAKGAFTGAVSAHKGLFVQAAGGALMLDEIGDIPPGVQTKLLRVLQDGEVRPVGSNHSARINARIIAATNQDLEAKIRAGLFREDLFYRLNVLSIQTPPLRERRCDIPLLASCFLTQACRDMDIEPKHLSPAALASLTERDWPGNVRELQSYIRRVAVFSTGTTVDATHLRLGEGTRAPSSLQDEEIVTYKDAKHALIETFTHNYMSKVLGNTGGNISEAARLSGLERVSLQKILRRMNIDAGEFRK